MLQGDPILRRRGHGYSRAGVFNEILSSGVFATVYGPLEIPVPPSSGSLPESVVIKKTVVESPKCPIVSERIPGSEFALAHAEVILLERLGNHPNIIGVRDVFLADVVEEERAATRGKSCLSLCVVLEWFGESCEAIRFRPLGFRPDQIRCVLFDVASALDYVHSFKIIHADVKTTNILVAALDEAVEVGKQGTHAKLCDFNSSLQAVIYLINKLTH